MKTLQSMKNKRNRVRIHMLVGDSLEGLVTQMDDLTITILEDEAQFPLTIFKHAIESFTGVGEVND